MFKAWFLHHCFFLCSNLFHRSNADSLHIPIGGQLVYDTTSKTADLCLSPHMCPPCVFDALFHQDNKPCLGTTAATYSTEVSSSSTSPSPTAAASSSTELTSTESATTTETTAPTEEPASSTPTPTPSISSTDQTQPSASQMTSATETTEATQSTYTASTKPTIATPVGAGMELEGDALEVGLNEHNRYRVIHKAPALTLKSQLNSDAQWTAERCASQGKIVHTDDAELNGQGENLAKFCGSDETPEEIIAQVTEGWYREVCNYNFDKPGWSSSTGHFTQLVWVSTLELGLGWASNDERGLTCYYVAGRYYPSGNIVNRFEENVKRGSFDSSYCNTKRHKLKPLRKLRDLIWPKRYLLSYG